MAKPARLRHNAGVIGLLYASLGSIIGSGWLFGPLHAALEAGPLSVFSWIIDATAVLLLAFVFSELSTMLPDSGALVHMTHISHGDLVSKIWTWILFLAFVSVPPVEVSAVLTYANNYLPGPIHPVTGLLTHVGIGAAILLLGVVVVFLAVRWVMAINSVATWWKLIIPLATIGVLMIYSCHPKNMTAHIASVPISGIFTAVATASVIFSFFGFQQVIALAGETRNPGLYIPIALIGSVLIAVIVYVGLQISFIIVLKPADIAAGWTHLHFSGMFGPLAAIAVSVGAFWWAVSLYVDAIISPLGTGFIYATASPRIIMAAGEMGNAPKKVTALSRQGVPWIGLIVTYLIGLVFFFPFPSWQKLASAVVLITVLSYSIGPIILLHLRRTLPAAERPFRLRAAWPISILAFIASNWIIYWTGYDVVMYLFAFVAIYVAVYLTWYFLVRRAPLTELGWQQAWWLIPYFGGLWVVSYLGPKSIGGQGLFGFFIGMWILAGFSVVILLLALKAGLPAKISFATAMRVRELGSRGVDAVGAAEETAP